MMSNWRAYGPSRTQRAWRSLRWWWADGGWMMLVMAVLVSAASYFIWSGAGKGLVAIRTAATPQEAIEKATGLLIAWTLVLAILFRSGSKK